MATAAPSEAFAHSAGSSSSSSSSCSSFFARFKACRSTISFSTFSRKQWRASLSIARAFPAASIRPLFYAATEGSDPIPMVLIDQDSDMNATVVEVSFGDRLGALLDTMKALKDLGLDVLKGNVTTTSSVIKTKFSITKLDTGRKIENPELLEKVRLTILGNLLKYHPESSQSLAIGEAWGPKAGKKMDVDISTSIKIIDDGPKRSLLTIKTADKPGLLMDIIQIMNDINVNVESAEINTQGLVAKDTFHVNYHGQALSKPLAEVLTNCLRYHLRRPVTDDESY